MTRPARAASWPAVLALPVVLLLASCGGGPSGHGATVATAAELASPACGAGVFPSGMTEDATHSGSITMGEYTASGDLQAAMLYDGYGRGVRTAYTDLAGRGAPAPLVAECVGLQFGSEAGAERFIGSWSDLRTQAGSLVRSVSVAAGIGQHRAGFYETGQGFSGYGISSTDVVELAAQQGAYVFTVAVAGPDPSAALADRLLKEDSRR